jgi:MarR family transcriptional regulator, organic hydroperoxide resistance regulator
VSSKRKPVQPVGNGGQVPLARSVGYHVRYLAETWRDAMDIAASAHGITMSQWRYLRELWEEDGLTTAELTRRVGRQEPTTVVAVRLLERDALVTTIKSESDRRKTFIRLTPRGRRLAATMSPLIREVNDRAMSDLSDAEIRTFKRLIVRIQRQLDADRTERNEWAEMRTHRLAEEVGLARKTGGGHAPTHQDARPRQ